MFSLYLRQLNGHPFKRLLSRKRFNGRPRYKVVLSREGHVRVLLVSLPRTTSHVYITNCAVPIDPSLFPSRQLAPGKCTCRWIRILISTSDILMVRPFYTPTPAVLLIGAGATGKTGGFGQLLSAGVSSLRHGTRSDVAFSERIVSTFFNIIRS